MREIHFDQPSTSSSRNDAKIELRISELQNRHASMPRTLVEVRTALAGLYELLEHYAPCWYSQQHHEQAARALRKLDQP